MVGGDEHAGIVVRGYNGAKKERFGGVLDLEN